MDPKSMYSAMLLHPFRFRLLGSTVIRTHDGPTNHAFPYVRSPCLVPITRLPRKQSYCGAPPLDATWQYDTWHTFRRDTWGARGWGDHLHPAPCQNCLPRRSILPNTVVAPALLRRRKPVVPQDYYEPSLRCGPSRVAALPFYLTPPKRWGTQRFAS